MAKNPMAEWNNTEELMLETLEDEPQRLVQYKSFIYKHKHPASERYKNIEWKFVKLDNFSEWAFKNGYNEFELFPENADLNLLH